MTKYYIRHAKIVVEEADKLLQSVKNCINKSESFPIYLSDLQKLIDNLMYLNVAHNAANEVSKVKTKSKTKRK